MQQIDRNVLWTCRQQQTSWPVMSWLRFPSKWRTTSRWEVSLLTSGRLPLLLPLSNLLTKDTAIFTWRSLPHLQVCGHVRLMMVLKTAWKMMPCWLMQCLHVDRCNAYMLTDAMLTCWPMQCLHVDWCNAYMLTDAMLTCWLMQCLHVDWCCAYCFLGTLTSDYENCLLCSFFVVACVTVHQVLILSKGRQPQEVVCP